MSTGGPLFLKYGDIEICRVGGSAGIERRFWGIVCARCCCFEFFMVLAALACELNLDLCHFDVEQAFAQSDLEGGVYMRLPRGYGRMSGNIVRLSKSLYGLKQPSRQ